MQQPDTVWHQIGVVPAPIASQAPQVGGNFDATWQAMLDDLLTLWQSKYSRNCLKMRYYNGKNVLKDFGISIPPYLRNVETVVGWPQKAVDTMAVRSRFDGFTATDATVQQLLDEIQRHSRLNVKYRQAVQSTLIHSCSFATETADEGGARIDFFSAARAAARWDEHAGRIAYAMVIQEFENGAPTKIDLFTDDALVRIWKVGNYWDWEAQLYSMGRPTIEALVYRPTFDKPFGQSRISRAVMSITDSAVRESLRTEISAEFFTSPQKYLLGAEADTFATKTKWEAYIGNIFAVSRDENGDLPQFGQLSQGSMQPHTDYIRSLAARFSGETNVPISTLGVIHDNPASAEAIYAASEPLIIECEDFNDGARDSLRNLALMAMAADLGVSLDNLPDTCYDFTPDFRNPAMPSIVSQTDAMVKIASVVPEFAGTDVFFEQIGFAEDMRRKARAEIKRNRSAFALSSLMGGANADDTASS